jgi:hypothetical protein
VDQTAKNSRMYSLQSVYDSQHMGYVKERVIREDSLASARSKRGLPLWCELPILVLKEFTERAVTDTKLVRSIKVESLAAVLEEYEHWGSD